MHYPRYYTQSRVYFQQRINHPSRAIITRYLQSGQNENPATRKRLTRHHQSATHKKPLSLYPSNVNSHRKKKKKRRCASARAARIINRQHRARGAFQSKKKPLPLFSSPAEEKNNDPTRNTNPQRDTHTNAGEMQYYARCVQPPLPFFCIWPLQQLAGGSINNYCRPWA